MKELLLICIVLLLLALADLPIGYYTLLRIIVTIGAVAVVVTEFENGINFWIIVFSLIGKLFGANIGIYAEHNTGFTYWLGFIFGIGGLGGGSSAARR